MDDAHAPEIIRGQLNVMRTYLKARYRLSDLLMAQRNNRTTSNLKRWIENRAPNKDDLEEDSYKILKQSYMKRKDLQYLNKDEIVVCKRKGEYKVFYKYNSMVLPQLYQTEILFRSRDQMRHQGMETCINGQRSSLNGLARTTPVNLDFCMLVMSAIEGRYGAETHLKSIESSEFNELVHVDHQKNSMTATG